MISLARTGGFVSIEYTLVDLDIMHSIIPVVFVHVRDLC